MIGLLIFSQQLLCQSLIVNSVFWDEQLLIFKKSSKVASKVLQYQKSSVGARRSATWDMKRFPAWRGEIIDLHLVKSVTHRDILFILSNVGVLVGLHPVTGELLLSIDLKENFISKNSLASFSLNHQDPDLYILSSENQSVYRYQVGRNYQIEQVDVIPVNGLKAAHSQVTFSRTINDEQVAWFTQTEEGSLALLSVNILKKSIQSVLLGQGKSGGQPVAVTRFGGKEATELLVPSKKGALWQISLQAPGEVIALWDEPLEGGSERNHFLKPIATLASTGDLVVYWDGKCQMSSQSTLLSTNPVDYAFARGRFYQQLHLELGVLERYERNSHTLVEQFPCSLGLMGEGGVLNHFYDQDKEEDIILAIDKNDRPAICRIPLDRYQKHAWRHFS